MTLAFQIGGPANQNELLVVFIFVCIFTAILSGEWLDNKAKALLRKQDRINRDSEHVSRAILMGRCTVCQERQDTFIKPFDWAADSGDAA